MSKGLAHPHGLPPPQEWWTQQDGHASAEQFRAWLQADGHKKEQKAKFKNNAGFKPDLGFHCDSDLEANYARVLVMQGYQTWKAKGQLPPAGGRWFQREGTAFLLTLRNQTTRKYTPDFQVWDERGYRIVECKGCIDKRAKQTLTCMAKQYGNITLELITAPVLEGLALQAMREKRQQGGCGIIAQL